ITRQPAIRTKNLAEVTGKRLFDFEQTATLQKLRPSRFSILPRDKSLSLRRDAPKDCQTEENC
ncbi:MAG: hypothetical protein WCB11_16540, partial [Terriglobales bacterium]